jgi:hypothetical protein
MVTTILITLLKYRIKEFIHRCFSKKNGDQWYQYSIIGRYKSYFVKSHSNSNNEYKQDEIIQILHFLTDTIFVMFGGWVFQLVFQWVRIVLRYSPICFYMLMKQTSFNGPHLINATTINKKNLHIFASTQQDHIISQNHGQWHSRVDECLHIS